MSRNRIVDFYNLADVKDDGTESMQGDACDPRARVASVDFVQPLFQNGVYRNHANDYSHWKVFGHLIYDLRKGSFRPHLLDYAGGAVNPIFRQNPAPPAAGKSWASVVDGRRDLSNLSMQWLGHASFLFDFHGNRILTDPALEERVDIAILPKRIFHPSPLYFRMTPPGLTTAELPHIDTVLATHNHGDHFDMTTVEGIWERFRSDFLVPAGTGTRICFTKGIHTARDMTWWDRVVLKDGTRLTAVPAHHSSCFGIGTSQKELWNGWMIEIPIGDSGPGNGNNSLETERINNIRISKNAETDSARKDGLVEEQLRRTSSMEGTESEIAETLDFSTNNSIPISDAAIRNSIPAVANKFFTIYATGDTAAHLNPSCTKFDPIHWDRDSLIFGQIHRKFPSIDLLLAPIDPIYGEENLHANLDQLVDLINLMNPKMIVPMHWGTWPFNQFTGPMDKILGPIKAFESKMAKIPHIWSRIRRMDVGEKVWLM